jgi:hypothetical protein
MQITRFSLETRKSELVVDLDTVGGPIYLETSSGDRYHLREEKDGSITLSLAERFLVLLPRTANSIQLKAEEE